MQIYSKSIPFSNKILQENSTGGRILDIGGAHYPGRINLLSEDADEAFLLDPEYPSQAMAPKVQYIGSKIEEAPEEHYESFDNIIASNVLEHLDDPDLAIKSIKKLLKTNGRLHILTPNCESLNRRIGVLMGAMDHIRVIPPNEVAIGHVQTFTVADMRSLLQSNGFEIRVCRGVLLKPVPTPEMIEWPEERIQAYFEIAAEVPPELCHEVYFHATLKG